MQPLKFLWKYITGEYCTSEFDIKSAVILYYFNIPFYAFAVITSIIGLHYSPIETRKPLINILILSSIILVFLLSTFIPLRHNAKELSDKK